ncbi:MAG: MFS transporter, partial [Nonomuraea sp.]|nr:MFS transporter [Nonomuraea sp.]
VLSTAQQFAGAAGVAVIGTIFFGAAGPAQDNLRAMEVSALINLAVVAVVTLLL